MFDLNRIYNLDCMEAMKEIPDKFFQLAICDPPYGIGHDGQRKRVHNNPKHNRKFHARKGWDREPPRLNTSGNWNACRKIKSFSAETISPLCFPAGQRAGWFGIKGNMGFHSLIVNLPIRRSIVRRGLSLSTGPRSNRTGTRFTRRKSRSACIGGFCGTMPGPAILSLTRTPGAGQAVSPVMKWALISWRLRSTRTIAGRRQRGWTTRGRKSGSTNCRRLGPNR